jgi:hypothetical protein
MRPNQFWEIMKVPGKPVLYHLNCKGIETGKHTPDVSVMLKDGLYKVSMPARTAGAALYHEGWTLDQVNDFLKKLGYPELQES